MGPLLAASCVASDRRRGRRLYVMGSTR